MSHQISLIVYTATDLAAAKSVYGKLFDAEPYADSPTDGSGR